MLSNTNDKTQLPSYIGTLKIRETCDQIVNVYSSVRLLFKSGYIHNEILTIEQQFVFLLNFFFFLHFFNEKRYH